VRAMTEIMNKQFSIRNFQFIQAKGFTLIELLTVLAIVSILAIGLLTVMNPLEQLAKSKDAKIKSDLANIQKALEVYYSDNGAYPSSADGKILDDLGQPVEWGTTDFQPYIKQMPKDTTTGRTYFYHSNGQTYWIYASLHRAGKDPAACRTSEDSQDAVTCPNASEFSCGNGICNYGVSSPNTSP
jgi:general secretion pathway protein G